MTVNNISVLKVFLIVFSLTFADAYECHSQGAWNMLYYPLDSLDGSFKAKEIRIDLKKSVLDVYDSKTNIRRHFNNNDSAYVGTGKRSKLLIERWKIYADHGALSDQYLEFIDTSSEKKHIIREVYLKSVNKKFLILEGNFYCISKGKEELVYTRKVFRIPKKSVKGFLTKITN